MPAMPARATSRWAALQAALLVADLSSALRGATPGESASAQAASVAGALALDAGVLPPAAAVSHYRLQALRLWGGHSRLTACLAAAAQLVVALVRGVI